MKKFFIKITVPIVLSGIFVLLGCDKDSKRLAEVHDADTVETDVSTSDSSLFVDESIAAKESGFYEDEKSQVEVVPEKSKVELLLEPSRNIINRRKFYVPDNLKVFYSDYRQLIRGMKINKAEGLELYSDTTEKNIVTVLPDHFNVTVSALGEEVEKDGIQSAWVEVVKPRYTWKNQNVPEFGWIFGGYLEPVDTDIVWNWWDSTGSMVEESFLYEAPDFNSPKLYELDENGYSHSYEYLKYHSPDSTDDYYQTLLEFAAAGVCGDEEIGHNLFYRAYWCQVQKAREIYPVDNRGRTRKINFESLREIASDFDWKSSPWRKSWTVDFEFEGKPCQLLLTQDMVFDSSIYSHYEFNVYLADDEGARNIYQKKTSSCMVFNVDLNSYFDDEKNAVVVSCVVFTETGMIADDYEEVDVK